MDSGYAIVPGRHVDLTRTYLNAVRVLSGAPLSLPTGRAEILTINAPLNAHTNLSIFVIVDIAANYYKHHAEWPEDWTATKGLQQRTIELAKKCGMRPRWLTENLRRALDLININPTEITAEISEWRHGLARQLYKELKLRDEI